MKGECWKVCVLADPSERSWLTEVAFTIHQRNHTDGYNELLYALLDLFPHANSLSIENPFCFPSWIDLFCLQQICRWYERNSQRRSKGPRCSLCNGHFQIFTSKGANLRCESISCRLPHNFCTFFMFSSLLFATISQHRKCSNVPTKTSKNMCPRILHWAWHVMRFIFHFLSKAFCKEGLWCFCLSSALISRTWPTLPSSPCQQVEGGGFFATNTINQNTRTL